MPRFRGPQGQIVDATDVEADFYERQGFTPVTSEQEYASNVAAAAAPQDGGALGAVQAGTTGFLSGLTLGGSDVLLSSLTTDAQRKRLAEARASHPILSTVGEVGGGIAAAVAAPGSLLAKTPTGYLARAANVAVGNARATTTGVKALAAQTAITGAEAAAQNVGTYLGSAALGDRKLTAEGLGGALGAGFAFGAAGGAAAYGIEKGTIAARRMFSSVMDGGDDAVRSVGGEWDRRSTEAFEANRQTLDAAKQRLADAQLKVQQAAARVSEEKLYASRAVPDDPVAPVADPLAGFSIPGRAGQAVDSLDTGGAAKPFDVPGSAGRAVDEVSATPMPEVAKSKPPTVARTEVVRVGKPSAGTFEKRTWHTGATEPEVRPISKAELDDELTAALPDGFRGGSMEVHRGYVVEPGIPTRESLKPDALYVVRPSELAERGIMGNELKGANRDSILQAWSEGKRIQPVEAKITPDGRLWIEDGNHRVQAASRTDRPVAIRFKSVNEGWKPQAGARDITERIKSELPSGSARSAQIPSYKSISDELARRDELERLGKYDELESIGSNDPLETTVRARDIDARGYYEPKSGGHIDPVRTANARKAIEQGQRDPVKLAITEDNKIVVVDGRHRLNAAIELDAPIKVKWDSGAPPKADDVFRGGGGTQIPTTDQRLSVVVSEAEQAESELMRLLGQTKSAIDEGASLGQLGIVARAQPPSPQQLTSQYDQLVEAADAATDAATKQQLLRQASVVEEQLSMSGKAMTDLDSVIGAMNRYEKAMAEVTEELGDAAHPMSRELAGELRKSEDDVARQMLDRATHVIDDTAEEAAKQATQQIYGPNEQVGPVKMSPKQRIAYARDRKLEADVAVKQARIGVSEAKATVGNARRAAGVVGLPSAPTAAAGQAGRALNMGAALEIAGELGLPGLPKPSDLPLIGPVLGLYLKARAIKAGADRLMGRVPATGEARVAAAAASTKDRAARAVDRMLGQVERRAPQLRSAVAVAGPKLVEAVRERLHDDGNPASDATAGLQEHVAARSREISALATNPTAIVRRVRSALRDVRDPDMVNAAVEFERARVAYLDRVRPKEPPPSPFQQGKWKPDKLAATDFARRYAVAMDPVSALEQIEQRCLTPEAAEAYREVYPLLFEQTRQRLLAKSTELKTQLPRQQLTRMSILFDLPLDSGLEPETLSRIQAAFAPKSPAEPSQQPVPPAPSIAGTTNLTALFQPTSDRRAAMR